MHMKTEAEKDAMFDQFEEMFDNITDKYDAATVTAMIIPYFALALARVIPGDRPSQLQIINYLTNSLRETIEQVDPDAPAVQ
jgi:hypothetical protein